MGSACTKAPTDSSSYIYTKVQPTTDEPQEEKTQSPANELQREQTESSNKRHQNQNNNNEIQEEPKETEHTAADLDQYIKLQQLTIRPENNVYFVNINIKEADETFHKTLMNRLKSDRSGGKRLCRNLDTLQLHLGIINNDNNYSETHYKLWFSIFTLIANDFPATNLILTDETMKYFNICWQKLMPKSYTRYNSNDQIIRKLFKSVTLNGQLIEYEDETEVVVTEQFDEIIETANYNEKKLKELLLSKIPNDMNWDHLINRNNVHFDMEHGEPINQQKKAVLLNQFRIIFKYYSNLVRNTPKIALLLMLINKNNGKNQQMVTISTQNVEMFINKFVSGWYGKIIVSSTAKYECMSSSNIYFDLKEGKMKLLYKTLHIGWPWYWKRIGRGVFNGSAYFNVEQATLFQKFRLMRMVQLILHHGDQLFLKKMDWEFFFFFQ